MALIFDDKGNLQPYGVIESDLADFEGKINGLDCYLVQSYPEKHRKFLPYQMERLYWLDLYTLSNPKYGKPQSKGFVQPNF